MAASHAEQLTSLENPHEAAWNRYFEAIRMPEEFREKDQEYFEEVATKIKSQCLDPSLAEHLDVGADFYRWFLFADRGSALPPSLALRKLQSDIDINGLPQYVVGVHPNHPASAYGSAGVIDAFTELAHIDLAPLFNTTKPDSSEDEGGIFSMYNRTVRLQQAHEALVDIIKTSPVYGLLQSFNEPSPQHNQQRPLSVLEKQVRETTINQQVRQKYGLQNTERIQSRSQADLEIRKHVAQLDDELVAGKNAVTISPAERARDYFVAKALEIFKSNHRSVERVEYDAKGRPTFVTSYEMQSTESFYGLSDVIGSAVAIRVAQEMGSANAIGSLMDEDILRRLMSSIDITRSWSESIKEAVEYEAKHNLRYLSFGALYKHMRSTNADEERHNNIVGSPSWTQILRPEGEIFGNDAYKPAAAFPEINKEASTFWNNANRPSIVASEAQEELERQTIATVARNPEMTQDTTSRLVIVDGVLPELPVSISRHDLQITFAHAPDKNVFVPGYRLVAANTETGAFQFTKSELDPYVSPDPDIVLVEAGKQRLSEFYKHEHFDSLAHNMPAGAMGIQQIIEIISQNSDYTYDTELHRYRGLMVPVRGGRPQVQCTGAAFLLQHSLHRSLWADPETEDYVVSVIDGYVLNPGSDTISAIGHRQVILNVKNQSYILDATPAGDMATQAGLEFRAARSLRQRRFMDRFTRTKEQSSSVKKTKSKPDFKPEADRESLQNTSQDVSKPQAVAKTVAKPLYESVAAQRAAERKDPTELRGRLEQQLIAAFHVNSRDALMKSLITLPKEDPVRKTLAVALQSTSREGITDNVESLKIYLANYHKLTAVQRKQYRLHGYNQQTLQMLSSYVDELSTTL